MRHKHPSGRRTSPNPSPGERGFWESASVGRRHLRHAVALADEVDDVQSGRDPAEDGVATIQVRRIAKRDEELAAAGVLARVGDPDRLALVGRLAPFAADRIARAAPAVTARAAALHDEARNDPVEDRAVEVAGLGALRGQDTVVAAAAGSGAARAF